MIDCLAPTGSAALLPSVVPPCKRPVDPRLFQTLLLWERVFEQIDGEELKIKRKS